MQIYSWYELGYSWSCFILNSKSREISLLRDSCSSGPVVLKINIWHYTGVICTKLQNALNWCYGRTIFARFTMTSRECSGVPNHQQLDGLFNYLFELKEISKPVLLTRCACDPPVTSVFPHRGPVARKTCPCRDVVMKASFVRQDILYNNNPMIIAAHTDSRYHFFSNQNFQLCRLISNTLHSILIFLF